MFLKPHMNQTNCENVGGIILITENLFFVFVSTLLGVVGGVRIFGHDLYKIFISEEVVLCISLHLIIKL